VVVTRAPYALFVAAALALLIPRLAFSTARLGVPQAIEFNEGWNAFHAARLMAGGPLYRPSMRLPIAPVNYPPLSFVLVAGLGKLGADVVQAGRVLSLASALIVGLLIAATVRVLAHSAAAGWFALLTWLLLLTTEKPDYVGMNDPQLLGLVFAVAALAAYARWQSRLTSARAAALALLCCTALLVKHLLVAGPITLALLVARRGLGKLASFVITVAAALFVAALLMWARWGSAVFSNLLSPRSISAERLVGRLPAALLVEAPFIAIASLVVAKKPKGWSFAPALFAVSFVTASLATSGAGVAGNAWFESYVACSLLAGWAASAAEAAARPRLALAALGVWLIVFAAAAGRTPDAQAFAGLDRDARLFQSDVARLAAIRDPVLFEDLLLGFRAGRVLSFDPFLGSQLMYAGTIPDEALTSAIEERRFGAIVLDEPLESYPAAGCERWTPRTLQAIAVQYRRLETAGLRNFYVPRASGRDQLALHELAVETHSAHQVLVPAALHDPPLVHHLDAVRLDHRREPVRDDDRRAAPHQPLEGLLDERLAPGVERARGLVEDEDPGILQHGPRDRDPLPLPARELDAALADQRVVTSGKAADEAVGVRRAGCRLDFFRGGDRPA
jgi:hypothetical protein